MSRLNNATIVLVECGMGSEKEIDRGMSKLEACKRGIRELLQYHIIFRKKDEIAVVLCGSETSNNKGDYDHIEVLGDVGGLDVSHSDLVETTMRATSTKKRGNVLEAIDVALSLFEERRKVGKKFRYRVLLLTDGTSSCEYTKARIDSLVLERLVSMRVQIDVVGLGDRFECNGLKKATQLLSLELSDAVQAMKVEAGAAVKDEKVEPISVVAMPVDVARDIVAADESKTTNVAPLVALLSEVSGGRTQCAKTLSSIVGGCVPRVYGTTTVFRGDLTIGESLRIPVHAFNRTTPDALPSLKKESCSASTKDREADLRNPKFGKVSMDRVHRSSVTQEEVAPEKRRNGFRYGADVVVLDDSDKHALTFRCDKCLQVLGFVENSQILRHHYLGKSVALCAAPNSERAAYKLAALRQALVDTGRKGIVRFVKRNHTQPFLGCIEPGNHCLVFNQLPFVEDIRDYDLRALLSVERFRPSASQLDAVDALIDALEMPTSAFPSHCADPVLSRFYRCLRERALDSKAVVDKKPDSVEAGPVVPSKRVFGSKEALGALSSLKREFKIVRLPPEEREGVAGRRKRKRTSFWGDRDSNSPATKKQTKGENESSAAAASDLDCVTLAGDALADGGAASLGLFDDAPTSGPFVANASVGATKIVEDAKSNEEQEGTKKKEMEEDDDDEDIFEDMA